MSFYVSTATFFLLQYDEWGRVVALPRHKFVTGATLLQLLGTDHLTCMRGLWFLVSFINFFSDNTRVMIFIFFCRTRREFFFQNLTLGYMTITLNQIFFFLHQNQNIFFSNIGNQNIFFLKKNHTPTPWKLSETPENKKARLRYDNVPYLRQHGLMRFISLNIPEREINLYFVNSAGLIFQSITEVIVMWLQSYEF